MSFLRACENGVYLAVKVQPRASRNALCGVHGNELKISVTAPPVDSAANQAVIEFLAEKLDCSRSTLELVRGHTSRHKTIFLRGLTSDEVVRRLGLA